MGRLRNQAWHPPHTTLRRDCETWARAGDGTLLEHGWAGRERMCVRWKPALAAWESEACVVRAMQRHPLARAAVALALSALATWVAWQVGTVITLALLVAALFCVAFALLTLAPDLIAHWRGHRWRWWWRAGDDEGPFWPGTRVPRHPGPPRAP